MSRRHFVLTCLSPNIVLGFIPYITFLLFPKLVGLGLFGIICIGMGFGDWINVYHALKQMPRNAKTYLCGSIIASWLLHGTINTIVAALSL